MDGLIPHLALVFGTKTWLRSLEDYLEKMTAMIENGYPESLAELKTKAEEEGWEYADYDVGRQELEGLYRYSFPRILAFSTITLTYMVVEARLNSVADFMRKRQDQELKISEFRGDSLSRAATYFRKVLGVPLSTDPSWQHLRDLEFLRHQIVHRAGKIGNDQEARDYLSQIEKRVGGMVGLDEELGGPLAELRIDFGVCNHYVREAHDFFDRLFDRTGLLARSTFARQIPVGSDLNVGDDES